MGDVAERLSTALADRYRLEQELGQGGMATVYLAEDLKHHRQVAVKVLRPELAEAIGPERFLREIETTASLHHPHILPLYDSGEADGFLYYVMPYVEGESLRDRLDRDKQLPLDDALGIAREVADALSFAHSRGIVHRDIKPDNILLASGHAVVADFGIARAVSAAGGDRLTATGMAVGTPLYMSPEQAAGESEIDGRSDLYSLACVLYEMLAGQPPFTGPTAESVVRQHLTTDARPIAQLRPAVPPAIADVLARALAKNPADRFSPAAQFATALGTTTGTGPTRAHARPTRVPLAAGLAAVLLALTALVVSVWRTGEGPVVAIGRTMQVTGEAGLEVDPSLSPDGTAIAYAAGPTNAMQIYVRQVSGGRPVALTDDTTNHFRWPRWSPDGTQIAYQSPAGIDVVPALGGAARRLIRIDIGASRASAEGPIAGFDWSPDGSRIVWAAGFGSNVITVVTLSGGDTTTLAAPEGTFAPVWSPDGRYIAVAVGNPPFIFGTGYFANAGPSSIWVVPVDGAPATQVTSDSALNVSPQWSADGRDLLWVSDRDGNRDVYQQRIRSDGTVVGVPRRVTTGANAQGLSMSRAGGRLAYSQLVVRSSIWSIPVPTRGPVSIRGATRLTTRNEIIEAVDVSPDGRWLVFDSDRGGNPDLYVMPAAGGEARQLTDHPAGDFSGDWSPDGRRIAFHSTRNGNRDIFTVEADGTGVQQWTSGAEQELDVAWAPDGESIVHEVFGGETGWAGFVIRRLVDESRPESLAIERADFAEWSPDGRSILYHAVDGIGVHRVDTKTDAMVTSNAADGAEAHYAAWSPDGSTIYYLARSPAGWTIRAVGAAGGASTVLVRFDDPTRQHTRYGFSTDGRFFYLTIGAPESDLVVAELEQQ